MDRRTFPKASALAPALLGAGARPLAADGCTDVDLLGPSEIAAIKAFWA